MAAHTVTLEDVVPLPGGRFRLDWTVDGKGLSLDFESKQQGIAWVEQEEELLLTEDGLIMFALLFWRGRDANFNNPNMAKGQTLIIDFSATNPVARL